MSVAWLDENFDALQNQIAALSGTPTGGIQVYNTVQTNTPFVIPAGVTKLKVTVIGGGGAGSCDSGGSGGGGGGTAIKFLSNLTPGNTLLITVGAGGTAAPAGGGTGGSGGSSSVGPGTQTITAVTATGGIANGGAGGTSTSGDLNIPGGRGEAQYSKEVNFGPCAIVTLWFTGQGGGSAYGQPGIYATAGGFPGGGGAGSPSGIASGAGAVGAVIIEW